MVFWDGYNGGNCNGCEWIIAEGKITKDSPNQFLSFLLKEHKSPEKTPPLVVKFNSAGGNLIAAVEIGEIIRRWGLQTSVGKSVGKVQEFGAIYVSDEPDGICASACVYAFLGGEKRFAGGNTKLGVHQFYDAKAIEDPIKKSASGIDRSVDQLITGLLLEYVVRMGIDARLISLASRVPPWKEMHWLSEAEIFDLGIDNTEDRYTPIALTPFGRGGATVEVKHVAGYSATPGNPTRFRLYCRGKKAIPHLSVLFNSKSDLTGVLREIAPRIDFKIKSRRGISTVRPLVAAVQAIKQNDQSLLMAVSWAFPTLRSKNLIEAKEITAVDGRDGGVPRVYWSYVGMVNFKITGDPRITRIAFQHCVPT